MAYNKAREEKQWKQKEEVQTRELGMEEDILKLRELDWADFNDERRYCEYRTSFPNHELLPHTVIREPEPDDIQSLPDSVEDRRLLQVMLETDRKTLQILLLHFFNLFTKLLPPYIKPL